ncbi:MAG TPA: hypothetical protein VH306_14785 [Gaiellaceae bacterium]
MPHDHPPSPAHKHPTWVYVVIIVVLVGLAIWGIAAYRGHKETQEATAKAEQLQQKLEAAGLPTFADTDQIAGTLGTDGGAVCDTPGQALTQAFLKQQLANGAGGPGQRPVTVAKETLQGEFYIIQVYCPEKLEDFKDFLADLDFDDVVRD